MESLEKIKRYIFTHNPDGIILDTNILILFLIGKYDKGLIEKYELLNNSDKSYTTEDYEILNEIVNYFKLLVITPQILSEISNLSITKNKGLGRTGLDGYISSVAARFKESQERYCQSGFLWGLEIEVLRKYGFTDINMIGLSKSNNLPILTDDLALYLYAFKDTPVINYQTIKWDYLKEILNK